MTSPSTTDQRPRSSAWEWTQAALLMGNLAWTTLCLGGYRPGTMVVTSTLTAALLVVHGLSRVLVRADNAAAGEMRLHRAALWFLPFLIYAVANILWVSPVRWLGWFDWFGWAQMIAVFWVVANGISSRAPRLALFSALVGLALVAVLLGCYQRFVRPDWLMLGRIQVEQYAGRASGPFGIPNSLAALLLLVLPVTGALAFRRGAGALARVFFGWVTAVLLLGLVLTISRGAWLGLTIALTAWPLMAGRGTLRRRLGLAALALAVVLSVSGIALATSPKIRARFVTLVAERGEWTRPILWRGAWQLFREHPIVGTGGGSFNVLFESHRPEHFRTEPKWAHNDYLNTLSDYGIVGFGLFFGAVSAVVIMVRRTTRDSVPAASGTTMSRRSRAASVLDEPLVRQALAIGLLAFALQLFVDFHFKIPALAMTVAVLAALYVRSAMGDAGWVRLRGGGPKVIAWGIVGAGVGIVWLVVPTFRAEELRDTAREQIDLLSNAPDDPALTRPQLERARADLARARTLAPSNAQTWSDAAYAVALWSRLEGEQTVALGRDAEVDANHSLALSPVVAEFWIRRGVARDMQGRWLDAGEDFAMAITLSPSGVLPWYHYAYHLSLRSSERGMAEAMVAVCLRLDPSNAEAIRLRQRLASGPRMP